MKERTADTSPSTNPSFQHKNPQSTAASEGDMLAANGELPKNDQITHSREVASASAKASKSTSE